MRPRGSTTVLAALVAAAALLAACKPGASAGSSPTGGGGTATANGWAVNTSACPPGATTPVASGQDIKLGSVAALSGPAAPSAAYSQGMKLYFDKLNAEQGGVDGHKITLDTKDDQYDPAKTVPQVTSLIDQDEVLAVVAEVGTPNSLAARALLERSCTPQLFVISGDSRFGDPANHAWTTGGYTLYTLETRAWAQYIAQQHPGASVASLVLDNDAGAAYSASFANAAKEFGLKIVTAQKAATTATNIDGQITAILAATPDFVVAEPPTAVCGQLIGGLKQGGFRGGLLGVSYCAAPTVLAGAGDAANGYLWVTGFRDSTDPGNAGNPDVTEFGAAVRKYGNGLKVSSLTIDGYRLGKLTADTVKAAAQRPGGLTRANLMNAAWNLNTTLFDAYCGTAKTNGPADPFVDECVAVLQHTSGGTEEVTTIDEEGKGATG